MQQPFDIVGTLNKAGVPYTNIFQWDSREKRYIITLPSSADPINSANQLYETGDVFYSIPVFCIEDPFQSNYYSQQWGLKNTGQDGGLQGIDINVEAAWPSDSGQGITVAILDNGVELTHPDLLANLVTGYGYGSAGSNGGDASSYHGTCCAGIVAATNNNEGVKGVAFSSKIMPIKIGVGRTLSMDSAVVGIQYAYTHGADVINCSFSVSIANNGLPTLEMMPSLQALSNARTYGRNGKGCVIVCSSGNGNENFVNFPANQEGNLAVGAIDRCGIRSGGKFAMSTTEGAEQCDAWKNDYKGSCYGYALDVVAPGSSCYTTTVNSDYDTFGGTSAACPYVSGVAALVLSANPGLSELEVRNIICSTTTKSRSDVYTYATDPYHPLGTWNERVGYGLVNAYFAVQAAQNYDLYIKDDNDDDGTEPSCATLSSMTFNSPDIWLRRSRDGGSINQGINYGDTNYVYVRVHNRGSVSSSPTDSVKLFRRNPGSHMSDWPSMWSNVGSMALPSIPAGGNAVVCFPIYIPSTIQYGKLHYPLLAQIVSKNDGYAEALGSSAPNNAYQNNNIAIENVTTGRTISQYGDPTTVAADTYISNDDNEARTCNIRVKFSQNQYGHRLCEKAEVHVILSSGLLQCVASNELFTCQGANRLNDSTYIVWDSIVDFTNINIPNNEVFRLTAHVNFLINGGFENEDYRINVLQSFPNENEVGGSDIEISKDGRGSFYANAGDNILTERYSTVSLRAEEIGEPATYRWFNQNGVMVHSGQELLLSATNPTTYRLEVTATADGFRGYDTVSITLMPPHITAIVPNPTSQNTVTIQYSLPDSSTAQLRVSNAYSPSETIGTFTISTGESQSTIDISNFTQGIYSVSLVVNGVIVDTKNFVRYR